MRNLAITLTLFGSYICKLSSALPGPQGYQTKSEARGIMDEALKKFYFDLYDHDTDGTDSTAPNSDSTGFSIEDYFDTSADPLNKKSDDMKPTPPKYAPAPDNRSSGPRNNFFATPTPYIPKSPSALPQPVPQAVAPPASGAAPHQSQTPGASNTIPAADPTLILSRLLFHLSQLPSST